MKQVAKVTGTNKDDSVRTGSQETGRPARFTPTIPAPAEAERNINSAAEESLSDRIKRKKADLLQTGLLLCTKYDSSE